MSSVRFSPFSKKTVILSSQQQPQQQTPMNPLPSGIPRQHPAAQQQMHRKSTTPTNIPAPAVSMIPKPKKACDQVTYSDTDEDERDFFDEEEENSDLSNENLSREERFVLLHTARVEPMGQENLSGNVTPVNEMQSLNMFDKPSAHTPPTKQRYSTNNSNNSTDSSTQPLSQPQRYSTASNRSMSVEMRHHMNDPNLNSASNRSSLILQQQHSNRNSLMKDQQQTPSNRSSLDVSQSSYNTLIIHDTNNDHQPLFSPVKNDFYINSSPSPPNYVKKEKSSSRSFGGGDLAVSSEHDQYLNQSYVLKHLAKEVAIPSSGIQTNDSTRDSGVSENNSSMNNNAWLFSASAESEVSRNKSKSQPDLTKYCNANSSNETNNSTTTTLDFEQLELENNKLRQQMEDCLMKVSKSQKLEQEISNIYRVHEELVQSCERRERLERTARSRLQTDCRRLQELNRTLREQVEMLQTQLVTATQQHQNQISSGGRSQQDVLITQLVQQNKDLVDANKRQYIEIQAQTATLEEQRIHIKCIDNALGRLEEECRQKQLYVAQLQHALQTLQNANDRREQVEHKMRVDLENELTKDMTRAGSLGDQATNFKWQLHEKNGHIMRLEAELSKQEQRNIEESNVRSMTKMAMEKNSQDTERIITEAKQEKLRYLDEAHSAQRKVSEMQTRIKVCENRLAEKEAIIRALQGQKLYGGSVGNSYNLLNNNDCYTTSSSSIVSSAPTTPLIYNSSNYDLISQQQGSNPSTSGTQMGSGSTSYDLLGGSSGASILDYSGISAGLSGQLYQNYGQKMSTPTSTSNILSQNMENNNNDGVLSVRMSPSASCSSSSTAMLQNQSQQTTNSSSTNNFMSYDTQSLDQQRKTIDDQLKQLDGELLSKICCFPSLSGKKSIQPLLSEDISGLSTKNSDAFLQNLAHLDRKDRKQDEMILLEKQGRCSQKLRNNSAMGNLAQVSHTFQNMTDISNIGQSSANSNSITKQLPKIPLPPRKDRQSSAPPSALPRPPRTLKPPRKIEYGRLSESEARKSLEREQAERAAKNEYELKTSSLKRHQSPGVNKNFMDIKNELQMALNPIGGKNYGSMKNESSPNSITKIYYSNKPEFISTKNYQRFDSSTPPSPSSSDSIKRSFISGNSSGKKINFTRASSSTQQKGSRESLNSISSGSNSTSRISPAHGKTESKELTSYHQLIRTRTPPKYLPLSPNMDGNNNNSPSKMSYLASSPTKTPLPSSSVLHHSQLPPKPIPDPFKIHQRRASSVTRNNGENKYRIQF